MGSDQLALLAFGSGTLVAGAGAWLLRALFAPRTPSRSLRRASAVVDDATPRGLSEQIDHSFNWLIVESGLGVTPLTAFLICCSGLILCGGLLFLQTDEPLLGVGGALFGMLLPLLAFSIKRARRMYAIRQELPHVLDMLARATRAGKSIEQAIELVAGEAGGILGPEFQSCAQQLNMGRAFDRVVKGLASRIRIVEMRILSTTLIVQKQAGGRLSETLDRMSTVVRDRLSSQRQVRASTSAGRASTLVIATVSPVAYAVVFLFHRQHLQVMFDDPFGRAMLVAALVLEVVGIVWVMYLMRSEA